MAAKTSRRKRVGVRASRADGSLKKRPRPTSAPISKEDREQLRDLLRSAGELLCSYGEDLADKALSVRERVDLRTNLRFVADFVMRANGGRLFDRNRRWALLYELTKNARKRKTRPSTVTIAQWPGLPRAYAATTKDALAARELLAKSVRARSRYEWLELLVDAIAILEVDEMGDRKWLPDAFEATILAHRREERRVLGVSDDIP
jgi:hypothetical protein